MKRSAKFREAMDAYNNNQPELALRLMEECAKLGDPVACYLTALWYKSGDGIPVNLKRSAQWLARLEELAEQGNLEAQWEVGQHYRFGDLLPLNIERANYWLERAAERGYGEAQHHLAWYLETGQYDYPVDPDTAAKWYRRAFDQEHPETLYLFAVKQFCDGRPTEEAIRLLKKAADKGFKQAAEVLRSYTH
jgi:TPR repeat protein